jgi:acyl-coenzyme A synthetase/AMP-(fatty) acid ligase
LPEQAVAIEKIFELAAATPDKAAVIYNDVAYSYAQFARRIDAAREYLARSHLPPGSVAAVCIGCLLDAWTLGIALRSLGVTTVYAKNAVEASRLRLRNVSCLVAMENERPELLAGIPADFKWRVIRCPASIQRAAATNRALSKLDSGIPEGGQIMLTSGTTGESKKVLRDPVAVARALTGHADIYGISASSIVYVMNFGLWTSGGYRWPLITWGKGGTVIIHQQADLYRPLTRHPVTEMFSTPAMLLGLLQMPPDVQIRNDARRLFVTGGALSKSLLESVQQRLTHQVYSLLASTEASVIGMTLLEQADDLLWHRVDPAREVQVVDADGRVLGPGQEGLVRSRPLDGITGYLDDEEATRAFFRDGFFYSGDVGMFGQDGRLALRGRTADVINILGDKLATGPMERALQDRLAANGVCILTLDGAGADDGVYIVIQSARTIEQAEITAAAKAELAPITNVRMHFCIVKDLPRNDMGKIQRLLLKEALEAMRARDAGAPNQGS